ncbi:3'-5' exonuclease [Pseudomonas sp. CrR25]|nr:3'-5' exonuclease [Pseudomonas sp. CrR25]
MPAERIAVLDFETTGLTPAQGARATEIGVVLVEGGHIVDRYQSLMNSGVRVPAFIEQLTGISNAMLRDAPPAARVMGEVAEFVGDTPLLAHNATFDQKFWDAELGQIGRRRQQPFACSLLLARRLLPQAPSHKLGVLNRWARLPDTGQAHRALADAEMAANLLGYMAALLRERHGIAEVTHSLLCELQKLSAAKVGALLSSR